MERFSRDEIADLTDELQPLLPELIDIALIKANDEGKLRELLQWFGLEKILPPASVFESSPFGQIIVFGASTVASKDLVGVAKSLGISKQRLEFYDYNETKKYDTNKLSYKTTICAILVGAVPHSTVGKGDASSFITNLEKLEAEGIIGAKVVRLTVRGALKITKSNFKSELIKLMEFGKVKRDL